MDYIVSISKTQIIENLFIVAKFLFRRFSIFVMLIQNFSLYNNQNKYKPQYQQKNISFEANPLKLSKEIVLNPEQVEQLSFIAEIYKKAIDFSAKLNGPYRYKYKEELLLHC